MAEKAEEMGYAAMLAGKYNDAIRHYTDAINLQPSDYILYVTRCTAYINLKEFSKALKDAKQIIRLEPNWSKGYQQLGICYHGLGQNTDALSAFRKGLDLEPNNDEMLYGYARSIHDMKQPQFPDKCVKPKPVKMKKPSKPKRNVELYKDIMIEQNDTQQRFVRVFESDEVDGDRVSDTNKFSVSEGVSVVNRMVDAGLLMVGDVVWCFALDLIEDDVKRELFVSLPDDVSRLAWLNRKHDLCN